MRYTEIINRVSEDLNLSRDLVDKTYKSYWQFIKDTIQALPLKEVLNEEDFSKLKCNINIPSLGKLAVPYSRYVGVKKRFIYTNKKEKNDKVKRD